MAPDEEDPGIVSLINEISQTISMTEDHDMVRELVLCLLTSSPYWSEDSLRGIHHLRLPYLAILLQSAGLMELRGRSAQEAVIDFYRQRTGSPSHKKLLTLPKPTSKEEASTKAGKVIRKSSPTFKLENTGRLDHRGLPIKEQRRMKPEPFLPPPHLVRDDLKPESRARNEFPYDADSGTSESSGGSEKDDAVPIGQPKRGSAIRGNPDPSHSSDRVNSSEASGKQKNRGDMFGIVPGTEGPDQPSPGATLPEDLTREMEEEVTQE